MLQIQNKKYKKSKQINNLPSKITIYIQMKRANASVIYIHTAGGTYKSFVQFLYF